MMLNKKIRLLEIGGSPYDMGFAHGRIYSAEIRHFVEERIELARSGTWSGRVLSRAEVLEIADACVIEHQHYAPDLMQELQGISAASGTTLAELIIVNGFTDFVDTLYAVTHEAKPQVDTQPADNCTAFIVPDSHSADAHGYFGQTWDMHDTATPYVMLLRVRPENKPGALLFTITGCVGMIGMNAAGIAVGINNLLGGDGQIGVTWPFVVRKALQQNTIDAALACITAAKLAGSHNYLLFDKHGTGYNVEAMSTHQHITRLDDNALVHTNHCLVPETVTLGRPRLVASQKHSEVRLDLACQLLEKDGIDADDLMALTRADHICSIAVPPLDIESCGAAIMQPASGKFWAVWGLPTENEYELFMV